MNEAKRLIDPLLQERATLADKRSTQASTEDLEATIRDLRDIVAALGSGSRSRVQASAGAIGYRVVDRWSMSAQLSQDLLRLIESITRANLKT